MNDVYQRICRNVVTARHNDQTMLRRLGKAFERAKQTNCYNDREIAWEMWFLLPESRGLILGLLARLSC